MPPGIDASTTPQSPAQALRTLRVIWAAILLGLLTVAGVMAVLALQPSSAAPASAPAPPVASASTGTALFYAACGLFLAASVLGYVLRMQAYKRGYVGAVVTPGAYVTGNIPLFAMLEGVGVLAAVLLFVTGLIVHFLTLVLVVAFTLLLNFPNGRPMLPAALDELRA